jgi:hypothetical protein
LRFIICLAERVRRPVSICLEGRGNSETTRFLSLRRERSHPRAVHFDGNGALEKRNGQNQSVLALEFQQHSFQTVKGSMFDPYPLADLQERPWPARETGSDRSLKGADFTIVNGHRALSYSDDPDNSWSGKNWETVLQVKPAKNIARKERQLSFLDPVRPRPPGTILGKKPIVALPAKDHRHAVLAAASDSDRIPRVLPVRLLHSDVLTIDGLGGHFADKARSSLGRLPPFESQLLIV